MFKALLIVAAIAAVVFFGIKYQQSHPGGTNGVQINTPVYRPPSIPDPLKT
ncbi:MAG: hypothetical protein ACXVQY_02990 [Actinomycetota bacterium]